MRAATVADCINRLPWDAWIADHDLPNCLGLPPGEAEKVLRSGRRKGSVTVRRTDSGLQYKRVRRHPLPSQCQVAFS